MKTMEKYSVITGASTGLGRELAIESARRGRNLILVALPGRNLDYFCQELQRKFNIKAVAREYDLTEEKALDMLIEDLLANFSIDRLINNAGVGGSGRFEEAHPKHLDTIIQLNIRATTMLTRMLLPELMSHKASTVINIASLAAFGALPFKTVYPASKAFIYSFSRGLNKELEGTGVKVVVVAPGPIVTNPDVAMRIITQGAMVRFGLLTAGQIAQKALDGADKGKEVIVPGIMDRINRFMLKWFPEKLRLKIMARVVQNELSAISKK